MTKTDSLGRSTFHHIAPRGGVRPTNREILWLKHIERHGPQSSQYLYELTRDTHRCKDTALRQMQKLRAGGFLRLPPQQRATAHADFSPYIYDLTRTAKNYLFDLGVAEPTVRPTGHWWHGFLTSCVTSSIDITATHHALRYIPAHTILAKKNASFEIPLGHGKLIPDQLFALDYGGSFRAFALELDCGTEPINSGNARKSLARSVDQYLQILENQRHKSHYGLKANLIVLWVFTSRLRQAQFLKKLAERPNPAGTAIVSRVVDAAILSKTTDEGLSLAPWDSSGAKDFKIVDTQSG